MENMIAKWSLLAFGLMHVLRADPAKASADSLEASGLRDETSPLARLWWWVGLPLSLLLMCFGLQGCS
jgi:hypothetical protein